MTKEQFFKIWEFSPSLKADQEADQDAPKFDKERFERMFCAVVASREYSLNLIKLTELHIARLDAYYASKEGGENE